MRKNRTPALVASHCTRRRFLEMACAGAAGLALPRSLLATGAARGPIRKPNIVLIFSDDQGYADMGCHGCTDIPTPHMDAIAAAGARFTDGYVTAPVCSPSRAGLLTGRYQQRFGHEHNPGAAPEAGLPLSEKTIADHLKAAGYATGMVGKWHLGMLEKQNPVNRGFDEFFGFLHGAHSYLPSRRRSRLKDPIRRGFEPVEEGEYLTDASAREAVAFIDRHRAEPFFLYVPFNAVHSPLEATERYLSRFGHIRDEKRRTFAAMLSAMDHAVGAILGALRRAGLEENTLVFFISDNGGPTAQTMASNKPLRGGKAQMYEGGIRIPFLMQWKGRLPAGQVYRQPVSTLDVLPTALEAAGVGSASGAKLDGVDLLPFLTGRHTGIPHETLFWRMGQQAAVRKGRWKLVIRRQQSPELYDLVADIAEQRDLAQQEPDVLRKLGQAYEQWNAQMAEPLWVRKSFGGEQKRQQDRSVEQRFRQLDRDGDGLLTRDEVQRRQLFDHMDANRDGKVTLEEARNAFGR